jgi:hypothetical protein
LTGLRVVAALLALALALAGLGLSVCWTLDERVSGGHLVLGALFLLWVAQRGLEHAWRHHRHRHRRA